jgi:chromosome segregation ATPase
MAAALTREQAQAAVAAAMAQRDTIQANLLDLDGRFGKRLLAGASLAGQTRKRWDAATAALTRVWEIFTAYAAVVDRAAETLAHAHRSAPGLAEVTALLTGASVRLTPASSPAAQRDLTGTGDVALTLDAAVRDMKHAFAGAADVVTAAESVWNEVADQLQDVADQLSEAKRQTSGLTDDSLNGALGTAEADLARLRQILNSDPLALYSPVPGPGGQVDTAALGRLREQAAAVASRAAELGRLRADADTRITAAATAVSAAQAAWQDAMTAREQATVKIAAALPTVPDVAGLADRLAALDGLKTAGRWTRLSLELDFIEKQTATATARCRGAEKDAVALLDQRDELRGRLDAYRARAARLGAIEDSDLEAEYERARELLWTAPCDLPAAADAVTGYQQAVLALSGRERRP